MIESFINAVDLALNSLQPDKDYNIEADVTADGNGKKYDVTIREGRNIYLRLVGKYPTNDEREFNIFFMKEVIKEVINESPIAL